MIQAHRDQQSLKLPRAWSPLVLHGRPHIVPCDLANELGQDPQSMHASARELFSRLPATNRSEYVCRTKDVRQHMIYPLTERGVSLLLINAFEPEATHQVLNVEQQLNACANTTDTLMAPVASSKNVQGLKKRRTIPSLRQSIEHAAIQARLLRTAALWQVFAFHRGKTILLDQLWELGAFDIEKPASFNHLIRNANGASSRGTFATAMQCLAQEKIITINRQSHIQRMAINTRALRGRFAEHQLNLDDFDRPTSS